MGDTESASKFFQGALKYDPDNKLCREGYKRIKHLDKHLLNSQEEYNTGRYNEAVETCNQGLTIDAKAKNYNIKFLNLKGKAHLKLRDIKETIKACSDVIKIDGDNNEAFITRAEARILDEDLDGAQADFQNILQRDRGNREANEGMQKVQKLQRVAKRKDYYKILELPKTASSTDIKRSYRNLAKIWHPDKRRKDEDKEKSGTKIS